MNFKKFLKKYSLHTVVLTIIGIYQRTLSPDHSWLAFRYPYGYCRFYPSCSEYARQAIERKGVICGCIVAARRLARCAPWAKGGVDSPFLKT
ncbi:membrane protein insertion efficiency factor YidD [Candidatus Uhrbacteria bacterium]|nr:membrane protein insertion efficiency factor YidD [Candidatus Uhrbacteria bacterium]